MLRICCTLKCDLEMVKEHESNLIVMATSIGSETKMLFGRKNSSAQIFSPNILKIDSSK